MLSNPNDVNQLVGSPNLSCKRYFTFMSSACRILKRLYPDSEVGTTFSFTHVEPFAEKEKDIIAAKRIDAVLNRSFIEPSLGMGYPIKELPFLHPIEKYFVAGDDKKVEAGFGIFLCLSGEGELDFENSGKLAVKSGDAVVIPFAAGTFTVNNCVGILSRPPAA